MSDIDFNQIHNLAELKESLESMAALLPLAQKTSDIVHGEGSETAEVFFIGEAPGFHESVARRPFVGRSGQLLRKTLVECGLNEQEVWISNIVKVRPPDNRDPEPSEILAFKPFLDQEIKIIKPKLIVTLGRFSMAKFLKDVKISQVHGRLHQVIWQDMCLYVLPMYHPAAALRSTNMLNSFKADFEKIEKILDFVRDKQKQTEFSQQVTEILFN